MQEAGRAKPAGLPGLRSWEPGLAGLLTSLLPWTDVFFPQILQQQVLATRVNIINKYFNFHGPGTGMAGSSCCCRLPALQAVPWLWPCVPPHLAPLHLQNSIPLRFCELFLSGFTHGPREGAAAQGCTPCPTAAKHTGFHFILIYF